MTQIESYPLGSLVFQKDDGKRYIVAEIRCVHKQIVYYCVGHEVYNTKDEEILWKNSEELILDSSIVTEERIGLLEEVLSAMTKEEEALW